MNALLPSWTNQILRFSSGKPKFPKLLKRKGRNGRPSDKGPISVKVDAREPFGRDTLLGTTPIKGDVNERGGLTLEDNKKTCEPLPLGEAVSETSTKNAGAVVDPSEDLGDRLDEYKAKISQLECTVDNLKLYLKSTQDILAESQEEGGSFKERMEVLLQENKDLRLDLQRAENRLTTESDDAKMKLFELQVRRQKQKDDHRKLLEDYDEDLRHLKRVVEKQNEEISCSRAFLSPNDLYSAADIIQMVNALNNEIFGLAAFAVDLVKTDTLDSTDSEREMNIDMSKEWLMRARERMGEELYIYLVTEPSEIQQKTKILQWAIQWIVVQWCASETALFSADRSELEENLKDVYKGISLHGKFQQVASSICF